MRLKTAVIFCATMSASAPLSNAVSFGRCMARIQSLIQWECKPAIAGAVSTLCASSPQFEQSFPPHIIHLSCSFLANSALTELEWDAADEANVLVRVEPIELDSVMVYALLTIKMGWTKHADTIKPTNKAVSQQIVHTIRGKRGNKAKAAKA